jgi:hypothetical protein
MLSLPSAARSVSLSFSVAFTQPTFRRVLLLAGGAILTLRSRTVTGALRTLRGVVPGHPGTYHRVFARASGSLWPGGKVLAQALRATIPPEEPVLVPRDDTTAPHRGQCVYGKGCPPDAVRSAHPQGVFRWGHRWVVLAISVPFPFTWRRGAWPVLVAGYRPESWDQAEHRRPKTAPDLARQLLAVLIPWFPARKFVFWGEGG